VSRDQDAGHSFIHKDEYDNCSSEDESDIPALIQWYLSDSDSSTDYRHLASRQGWCDDLSDDISTSRHSRQSEDTENPHWSSQWGFPNAYLDDEFEDDSEPFDDSEDNSEPYDKTIADASGLVCTGKWPYPSDIFSFHEMSSVSSSDSNCASSSSSEPSL
jgi:hypothetical protein